MRALSADGAEKYATSTDTTISTAVIAMLCHRNRVRVSGISPLMANSDGGIADLVAISMAADDDSPMAHTAPEPEIRGSPGGTIVQALHSLRQLAHIEAAEDQAQPPGDQRSQHREQRHQRDGAAAILGTPASQRIARYTSGVDATT